MHVFYLQNGIMFFLLFIVFNLYRQTYIKKNCQVRTLERKQQKSIALNKNIEIQTVCLNT